MRIQLYKHKGEDKINFNASMQGQSMSGGSTHMYVSDQLEISVAMKLRDMLDRAIHGENVSCEMERMEGGQKWKISESYEIDVTHE